MRFPICALAIATLSVAGCVAPQVVPRGVLVQFNSNPMGALVLSNGVVIGRTPFAVPQRRQNGEVALTGEAACASGQTVTFLWDSGASVEKDVCRDQSMLMATRPTDAPGMDTDLRVHAKALKASRTARPTNWSQEYQRLGLQPANAGLVSGLEREIGMSSWSRSFP